MDSTTTDIEIPPAPRPTMDSVSPRWRALTNRLIALAARDAELFTAIQEVEHRLTRRPWATAPVGPAIVSDRVMVPQPDGTIKESVRYAADEHELRTMKFGGGTGENFDDGTWEPEGVDAPPKPISPATLALLGDLAPAPPPPAEKRGGSLRFSCADAKLAYELKVERATITEAMGVLSKQITLEHAKGSRELCALLIDDYRSHAQRVCAAVIELGNAVLDHREFTDSLVKQGASWSFFRPVNFELLTRGGDPREAHSGYRLFLNWAAESGHFDLSSIPEEWRPAPPPAAPAAAAPTPARRAVRAVQRAADTAAAYILQR